MGYKLLSPIKYKEVDIKERYSKTKIPKKIDYIIIGAGTSGLSAGACLSKLGYKVLVLESIGKFGGSMHIFGKNGLSFDTGFHYIGNDSNLKRIIQKLSAKEIEWVTCKNYDSIKLGGEKFDFKCPEKEFFQDLEKQFPDQKEILQNYRYYCNQACKLYSWMNYSFHLPRSFLFILETFLKKYYKAIYGKTTMQIFDELGISKHKKLSFLLNLTPCGGLGASTEQLPFVLHAKYMARFNKNGSMYPKGGPKSIVEGLASTIVQKGGVVLAKANVEEILVENNQVQGVKLCDGNEVKCKNVISTAGIFNTINMVNNEDAKKVLENVHVQKENKNKDNGHDFSFYSKFYGIDVKDLPLEERPTATNLWVVPGDKKQFESISYDEYEKKYLDQEDYSKMWSYIAFQTNKEGGNPDLVSVCQLGRGSYKQVEKFRINKKQRAEGYQEYKDKVNEELRQQFFKEFPQFKDKIVKEVFGTPLTIENYLNRKQPYGQQITTEKFFDIYTMFQTRTNVGGLHLSGQDTSFAGINIAVKMGFVAGLRASNYF